MWKFVLPGSSEIDWCETNYVQSTYVAEFYNTVNDPVCYFASNDETAMSKNILFPAQVSNVVYLTLPPLLM